MRAVLTVAVVLAGCGGSPKRQTPPPTAVAELSPALMPLSWWLGHWNGPAGAEHWVAAAGAIYGIAFDPKGQFEVMIVDDAEGGGKADGVWRLWAMPGGTRSVLFTTTTHTDRSAVFANPEHDAPTSITYARKGTGLEARLAGGVDEVFELAPTPYEAAPALEQADLAFAAATKDKGVAGWVDSFAPDGWMWRKAGVVAHDQIGETMVPLLASGVLAWAPIASGTQGGLGYTVGKATFTGTKPEDSWRSTYVTIWKRQPDGTWKVLFDTGRGVNEP